MQRTAVALVVGLSAALLAGCTATSSTSAPVTSTTPTTAPAATASTPPTTAPTTPPASTAPSAGPSLSTGAPTSLDPCVLVPASVASQLAGVTFTAGVEKPTQGGGKECDYGAGTTNLFDVIVAVAPNQATAEAGKAEAEAQILKEASKGLAFTTDSTIGDGVAYISGPVKALGSTVNDSALFGLKGLTFYGFSDLALTPTMSVTQLEDEAQAIIAQLP